MAMSYTSLVADKSTTGSIKSWMNYGKIDSEGVLEDAQAMIYERLRANSMIISDAFPIKVGASSLDAPDDFIEAILVKDLTNQFDLEERDIVLLEGMRSYTNAVLDSGDPAFYCQSDEALNFDCKTTTTWTAKVYYFSVPAALSASNPTNFITRRHPQLLRMACLATAARHNHDDDIFNREQKLLFIEIDEIMVNDEMARSAYVPVSGP